MISSKYTVYVFLLDGYRGRRISPSLPLLKIGYTSGERPYKRLEVNYRRESPNSYFDLFSEIDCIHSRTFDSLKEAKSFEKELLKRLAKKDVYIDENISGVTELRVALDWRVNELSKIFSEFSRQ